MMGGEVRRDEDAVPLLSVTSDRRPIRSARDADVEEAVVVAAPVLRTVVRAKEVADRRMACGL